MLNDMPKRLEPADIQPTGRVDMLTLYTGSDFVLTGINALNYYGLGSSNPALIELETITTETMHASPGVCYINSRFLEPDKVYDEGSQLWYVSRNKAILDTLTFCTDNSALEEAIIDLHYEGQLEEVGAYLVGKGYDKDEWETTRDFYLSYINDY